MMLDCGLSAVRKRLYLHRLWSTRELLIFMADETAKTSLAWSEDFEVNSRDSLILFQPCGRHQNRDAFLSQAESDMESGGIAVTLVEDGQLVAWSFASPSSKAHLSWVEQDVVCPRQSARLFSAYVAPRLRGRGIHTQQQGIRIAHMLERFEKVFGFVRSDNEAAISAARKNGMGHVATLRTTWRLFFPLKSVILNDLMLGMHFSAPIYSKEGFLLPSSEIHDDDCFFVTS